MTATVVVAILTLLGSLFGFGSAVIVSIRTGRKVDDVHGKVQEVKILVNGNLQKVQDQLAEALKQLKEAQDRELTQRLTGGLPPAPGTPHQQHAITITPIVAAADEDLM